MPALYRAPLTTFIILISAVTLPSFAQDVAPPTPVKETLVAIQKSYLESDRAYERDMNTIPSTRTPEVEKTSRELGAKHHAERAELLLAAVKIAEAKPKSPDGFAALEWVLTTTQSYYLPAGSVALNLMTEQYAAEPKIGGMLATLTYYFPSTKEESHQAALALLNAVIAQNPDRTARGHAALGLAWLSKRKLQENSRRGNATELAKISQETETAFEAIIRDYGDCANLRTRGIATPKPTLGGEAECELRELRFLSIGKVAPEIDGNDLNSVPMKLSEHRGKVVALVFWASWCGPCMAAVPHEKELVERFKGRPFVLIGVNGDSTQQTATQAVNQNQIPWRSFWNGPQGGSIAADWNVRGWPTIYVLDEKGTIREKQAHGKQLDSVLEKLVTAAEKTSTPPSTGKQTL